MSDNFDLANNIALRPIEAFSRQVLNNAQLISISKHPISYDLEETAVPFGSSTYRAQKYPGDVDLHEKVVGSSTEEVVSEFAKKMKERIRKINSLKDHWITEIKAGVDKRFDIDIGKLYSNNYTPTEAQRIAIWSINKYLKVGERERLVEVLRKTYLGADDFSFIQELVRDLKTLRWSGPEVLKGFLMHKGRKIKFEEALQDEASVKIDMVTIIDGLYVELTNFFFLGAIPPGSNQLILINTGYNFNDQTQVLKSYESGLKTEIEKLFYSSFHYNPFKGAKRMWAYSRTLYKAGQQDFARDIKALFPLVTGNISLTYQIKSTISTFLLVAEKMTKRALEEEYPKFVDKLKYLLSSVTQISNSQLETLYQYIEQGRLEEVKGFLQERINSDTCAELKRVGYWPIPQKFLPEVRGYI